MTVTCPVCQQELRPDQSIQIDGQFAVINGKKVHLPQSERWILEALLKSSPRVVTRDFLMSWLYSPADMPDDTKIIDVFICKLRKAIKGTDVEIETDWGRGYRLVHHDL